MKRKANAMMLLAALTGGCMSAQKDPGPQVRNGVAGTMKAAPNLVGPWGDPVAARPANNQSGIVQASAQVDSRADANIQQVNKVGVPQLMQSGAPYGATPMATPPAGAVAATGALVGGPMNPYGMGRTSIRFAGPAGMKVAWYTGAPGGGAFGPTMVEAPGRYNFPQGGIYRLKLADFPNRAGLELYPTMEIIPSTLKTATFLAHSAVPINITEEDLEQVLAGNFVVKVLYLPDPAYQDLTAAGPDEVVSSRLEPGVDPVAEAQRRGSVLAIIRIGNIDLEAPNTPAIDQPPGGAIGGSRMPTGALPPGAIPQGVMPPGVRLPQVAPGKAPGQISFSAEGGVMRMK